MSEIAGRGLIPDIGGDESALVDYLGTGIRQVGGVGRPYDSQGLSGSK